MSDADEEFTRENRAHVRTLANGLVALEEARDEETLAETFRAAHTLKGNLDMAGYNDGRALAHAVEDLLDAIRSGDRAPDPDLIDAALDATDEIESLIAEPPGDADSEGAAEYARELRDRLDAANGTADEPGGDVTAGETRSGSEPAPEGAGKAPESDPGETTETGLDFEAMESDPDEELSAEEALASVDAPQTVVPATTVPPSAAWVARRGQTRLAQDGPDDVGSFEPFYVKDVHATPAPSPFA